MSDWIPQNSLPTEAAVTKPQGYGFDGYCLYRPCHVCQGAVATQATTESETP